MLINIQTRHFHSSINHREQSFHKALITGYLRPMNIAKFLRTGFFIVTQVFSCEVGKIFKSTFSYRTPPVTASALPVAASVFFFKEVLFNSYFAILLWRTNNFFFSIHRLMYKKSHSFVYKFVVNCQIFWITPTGCTL